LQENDSYPTQRVGLQMQRGQAAEALKYGDMFLMGLVFILAVTPVVGRLVLAVPIAPQEFGIGLAVFCCMPTSLSANIALSGVRPMTLCDVDAMEPNKFDLTPLMFLSCVRSYQSLSPPSLSVPVLNG
jgi:hypothetical protein